jgi:biopolymer transport protein ExbB/TolQ
MTFRAFSIALWYISALFIFGIAVEFIIFIFRNSPPPLIGSLFARPNFVDNLPAFLILALFIWVLFEVGSKRRQVGREHAAVATFPSIMAQADMGRHVPKAFDLREPRAIRRANLIIECSQRDPSSLHDAVPAAAALDAGKLAASYTPLHVYAWILPVLGFIGTASGMASSISGFSYALRSGQGQVEALANQLGQSVIPGLSGAFGTTILALAAAVVAYLCTSALRSWDQEALDQLDRHCIVLLARIPQPEGPEGKKIVAALDQILEQLRGVLQTPISLESAANAIKSASETLAMSSRESASAALSISRAVSDLISGNHEATLSAAETLASVSRQAAATALAIKEATEALKSKKEETPPTNKPAETSIREDLISAIRDLKKAVTAPIHITLSRDSDK